MMDRIQIVIIKFKGNYSAYSPDLPGWFTVGHTVDEIKHYLPEVLNLHLHGMLTDKRMSEQPEPVIAMITQAILRDAQYIYKDETPAAPSRAARIRGRKQQGIRSHVQYASSR